MTTELHTYQNGTCIYCGAEEPEEHTHEYGEQSLAGLKIIRAVQ